MLVEFDIHKMSIKIVFYYIIHFFIPKCSQLHSFYRVFLSKFENPRNFETQKIKLVNEIHIFNYFLELKLI